MSATNATLARRMRQVGTLALLVAGVLAVAVPAAAQRRARLASDLARDLAQNTTAVLPILVQAPQSEVDRLALTYRLTVTKRIKSGAVLSGTAAQVKLLALDRNVSS